MVGGLGEVELAAEDGFEALLGEGVREVDRTVDVAVVGHGGRGLADLAEVSGELVDVTGAIKERVVRVEVQMGKLGGGHRIHLKARRRGKRGHGCERRERRSSGHSTVSCIGRRSPGRAVLGTGSRHVLYDRPSETR